MSLSNSVFPHRLLMNRSLHKEAQKLRTHIREYQSKYDRQYQNNVEELKSTIDRLNIEYTELQKTVQESLAYYTDVMQEISNDIAIYVSTYFDRKVAYKRKESNAVQFRIVDEYVGFLSIQMKEIGSEIDLLCARKEILSREAEVSDIIHLIQLSGCAIPVQGIQNAKDLIETVNDRMNTISEEDNKIEWYSLLSVRSILEERVAFLAEIQYITWAVEQKVQLSKELKTSREEQYALQNKLKDEAEQIQREIKEYSSILLDKAKRIRFFFAKQIVFIGAEIEDKKSYTNVLRNEVEEQSEQKKKLYDKKEKIQLDIEEMKEVHSRDDFRWHQLHNKKQNITDEIKDLKSKNSSSRAELKSLALEIRDLISQRTAISNSRKAIQQVMKSNTVPLIRIDNNPSDEVAYAEIRLNELESIETERRKVAEQVYQIELAKLKSEKDTYIEHQKTILSEIGKRLITAEDRWKIASSKLNIQKKAALRELDANAILLEQKLAEQQRVVDAAKKNLKDIQAADTRFIVIQWLSDTPEERIAKDVVSSEQKKLDEIQVKAYSARMRVVSNDFSGSANVLEAQKQVDQERRIVVEAFSKRKVTQRSFSEKVAEYEEKIKSLEPRYEGLSFEEQAEKHKIQIWKESWIKRQEKEDSL